MIKRINNLKVYMDQILGQGMTATVYFGKYKVKRDQKTTKINVAVKVIKSHLINDINFQNLLTAELEVL
jgi:serine/threonine protein kinase